MTTRLLVGIVCGFAIAGTAQAGSIIDASPVKSSSIKTYEYQGKTINVSHEVPERFIGTFELPEERLKPAYNPDVNWQQFARKIRLNRDGTGYWDFYGKDLPIINFEWGIVVVDDQLMVGQYQYTGGPERTKITRVHTLILRYDNNDYGYRFIYEHEGRLAIMPFIPVRVPMLKK